MFGHPRILKRGSGKLNLHKEDLKTMAIWIKFPSLNLACKTVNGLSKLASCIGIPFCMERLTASGSNPSHTRVLVDVSAESPLPDSLKFLCKGNPLEQEVEYLWKPNACKNCHIFNHSTRFCPFAQKQHSQASQRTQKDYKQNWVQKTNNAEGMDDSLHAAQAATNSPPADVTSPSTAQASPVPSTTSAAQASHVQSSPSVAQASTAVISPSTATVSLLHSPNY